MSCSDIAHFALLYKHCVKQFKGTLGSIAWVLIHAKYPARICPLHLGKSTKFVGTVILSPSNYKLLSGDTQCCNKDCCECLLVHHRDVNLTQNGDPKGGEIDS